MALTQYTMVGLAKAQNRLADLSAVLDLRRLQNHKKRVSWPMVIPLRKRQVSCF